jgi:uncharacterized protein
MKSTIRVLSIFLPLLLAACESSDTELRLHMPQFNSVEGDTLQPIFESRSDLLFVDSELDSNQSGLQALASGEADLALVENSSPFQTGVRAILPVFKSVMHILVREGIGLVDAEQPLRDRTIYVVNGSPAALSFIQMSASREKLTTDQFKVVDTLHPGETDIIIYFGPITARNPSWYVPGYRLFSLDGDNIRDPLSAQAIAYMLPHIEAATIPAQTYDLPGNEGDIHTLAVDTLLATRKAVPENSIFKLTRTLLQQKPRFVAVAPQLFSAMTESFDPLNLNFPLHSGARRYLARDEPSTLERYAETINMLMYLVFVLITGAFAVARIHSQKKKDRIDKFYSRVMAIRMRAMGEPHGPLLHELQQLELEAFDSLIAEKLAADDSFRIFIELLTRAMSELDVGLESNNKEQD